MPESAGWPHEVTARGLRLAPCAPHDLIERMGDKWTTLVLAKLSLAPGHRLRFSDIRYGVQGVSQRMLTVTLRQLERNGLVVRHVHAEVPPRVEYELTDMGESIQGPLQAFAGWLGENWPGIAGARERYDAVRSGGDAAGDR